MNIPTLRLGLLLTLFIWVVSAATAQDNRHQVAIRYIAPNLIFPLSNVPANLEAEMFFGDGLEFEYQRRFSPNFLLGFPLHLSSTQGIKDELVNTSLPINRQTDLRRVTMLGADALLVFEPIARRSFFDPQLFGGFGVFTDLNGTNIMELPVGLNLNFNLGNSVYLSPSVSYRMALNNEIGEVRDNLRLGLGLHFQLGYDSPKEPKAPVVVDTDGDGIPDASDRCPTAAGPAALMGCPDTDGDGVADIDDKCPAVAGLAQYMGCPDTDGDGVPDNMDDCPNEAGPASNKGCPLSDRDGDGVPDATDLCPDQAGLANLNGCPDTDGDGVADKDDDCPNVPGPAATRGCPDTDGDGVLDKDDRCPNEAGPASNKGCPELAQEDKATIEFAIQNINFETASATIAADSRGTLARVVDILNRYPGYQLAIGGHTDSIGSAEANQKLSERRAKAVYDYLVGQGIPARRMSHQGFGETMPIADNINQAGRELNRRVTLDLFIE